MSRSRRRALRTIREPFVVAAPGGARIRTRVLVTPAEGGVLRQAGTHLGGLFRADLAARLAVGDVPARWNQRTDRKRGMTPLASSRWAGSLTRAANDQYKLAMRALRADVTSLTSAIRTITARAAAPVAGKDGRVKGYHSVAERHAKLQRRDMLSARLSRAQARLAAGRPAVVAGGKRLLKARSNLDAAGLTGDQWRGRWDASRLFLTADGESGKRFGNETIRLAPDGRLSLRLPAPLAHMAPSGTLTLAAPVRFSYRGEEWLDRVEANQCVRYDISYDPQRDRWYIDASWSTETTQPSLDAATAGRVLAVDLNDGHFASAVIDRDGNRVGDVHTVSYTLRGLPAAVRDGHLRAGVSTLIRLAKEHGCPTIVVEDLNFADARATGRETMGRGRKGKAFRRTVAGLPTAQFRDRLAGMAHHAGLTVVAVDPAYTSQWGRQHWLPTLTSATGTVTRDGSTRNSHRIPDRSMVSGHHAAAVVIGRRALGHPARRNVGGAGPDQRISPPASRPAHRPVQPGRRHHSSTGQGNTHPTDRTRTPARVTRRGPAGRDGSP